MLEGDKHDGKNKARNGRWRVSWVDPAFCCCYCCFSGFFSQNAVIDIVLTKNQMMLENVHERGEGASLATARGGQKE